MTKRLREKANHAWFQHLLLQGPICGKRHSHELLSEGMFRKIYCWERKKAERSDKSFLLMLMNLESLFEGNHSERTLSEILIALDGSVRETDIIGWHREAATLGVIFSDIRNTGRSTPATLIKAKVTGALRASLNTEQVKKIQFSFHLFPEDCTLVNIRGLIEANLYPDLVEREQARRISDVIKRLVDIVGSVLALALCSPLLFAISLAIKLTSKGPTLFKQGRVGRYGQRFTFLKFRTMKCASDAGIHREYVQRFIAGKADSSPPGTNGKVVYKIQDDPRVTRVGKFLRRTSLDELPQLINVLKGEMSLVGPRPPIPYELEAYRPWHWRRVLEAKPGITGLWQVTGRSRLKFDDMVRLDLRYARARSVWSDIKILLQTPRAVFFCEGAY